MPLLLRNVLLSAGLIMGLSVSTVSADQDVELVDIHTNKGTISLALYPEKAPQSVANFLEYAEDDFYTGTIFHRIIPGFMAQGGGFTEQYEQKTTRDPIPNEASNGLKNERGTIAMARTQAPDSATAQFFINLTDNDFLDYRDNSIQGAGYAVFGNVTSGMEVVDAMADIPTGAGGPFPQDVPQQPVIIESVERVDAR